MIELFVKENLALPVLGSLFTAFGLSVWLGPYCIKRLSQWQTEQPVREYVPIQHLKKNGTPTMGGVIIFTAYVASILIWSPWKDSRVWITLLVLTGFGGIGLLDDWNKISGINHRGISASYKYGLQSIVGVVAATILYKRYPELTQHTVGSVTFNLGWCFIPWAYWVILASSNAFNLTDGLDGLAASQAAIIATGLLICAIFSHSYSAESIIAVAILYSTLIGSSLGFLCHNRYPAKIFMGDTGALALGSVLGVLALVLQQEIAFLGMAVVPVLETVSVILQVIIFKLTKKRLFRMAPFHHHLELLGYSEPVIVRRLSILAGIMVCFTVWSLSGHLLIH